MSLIEFIKDNREEIIKDWFDLIIESYPAQSSNFLKNSKNRFGNPIGASITDALPYLLDSLTESNIDKIKLQYHFDTLIHIRYVQEFNASQSVGFILLLKKVLLSRLEAGGNKTINQAEWLKLETKIDELLLTAFDLYTNCKEKIFDIRSRSKERETYVLDRLAIRNS